MNNVLNIIGIGPGDAGFVYPAALGIAEECDVLIGGRRNLDLFDHLNKEKVVVGNNLEEISSYIASHISNQRIAVLVTGDPGLYSMMTFLKKSLGKIEMNVFPGISSIQYLCSKLQLTWDDMYITSVHGREQENFSRDIKSHKKTALFTGGGNKPDSICKKLTESGFKGLKVTVGENLSYPNERIVTGSLEEIAGKNFDGLSIMIVEHGENFMFMPSIWRYKTQGLPDELFIRGDVPMTKSEIRAVSLSKLKLEDGHIVYDIGAGTGSVTVECALTCSSGRVYAIEKNPAAIGLIRRNMNKFELKNIEIIEAEAPEIEEEVVAPDRVFIGGSSGNMAGIFKWLTGLNPYVRIVVNAITIESAYEAIENFEKYAFKDMEIAQVAVSRGRNAGGKHLMQALNPVYIISGEKSV